MSEHLTGLSAGRGTIFAYCPEHHVIGLAQRPTRTGLNAVITEARAHDDIVHGVFREEGGYRNTIGIGQMSRPAASVAQHG